MYRGCYGHSIERILLSNRLQSVVEQHIHLILQQNEIAAHIAGGPRSMATNSGAADEILLSLQLVPITFL